MSRMIVDTKLENQEDSEDNLADNDDINNYKGIFNEEEEPEQRYYENGAHFSFKELCIKLESIYDHIDSERKGAKMYENDGNIGN